MGAKIVLLTRPGSGKSTVARHIVDYCMLRKIRTRHDSDYSILRERCLRDTKGEQFQVCKPDGFLVRDFDVYDIVLLELAAQIQERYLEGFDLVVVEFARSNCVEALSLLDNKFLENSSFLFLDASVSTCTRRIHERIQQPQTGNNHFVPADVLNRYSSKGESYYTDSVVPYLINERGLAPSCIQIVDNNAPWEKNAGYIYQAVEKLLIETGLISTPDLLTSPGKSI